MAKTKSNLAEDHVGELKALKRNITIAVAISAIGAGTLAHAGIPNPVKKSLRTDAVPIMERVKDDTIHGGAELLLSGVDIEIASTALLCGLMYSLKRSPNKDNK